MKNQVTAIRALVAGVLLLSATHLQAGIFDNPKNLEVLPDDITADELRILMREITIGTGNRCSGCHVGEIETDLSSYDFSLDDKEKKNKARKMLRMTEQINTEIASMFPEADEPLVAVSCATCHRGQNRPEMLQDVLLRTMDEEGIDVAIEDYRALRERYYGSHTYDFSPQSLMRLAETLAGKEAYDAAIRFLNLNLEFYPDSSRSYTTRALIHTELGNIDAARRDYLTALDIEPDSQWIRDRLDNLE